VSFLNTRGDLIVGHKGKLSRILAKDYLPDKSLFELPSAGVINAFFGQHLAAIPENFFHVVKRLSDELAHQNQLLFKKKPSVAAEEQQSKALMTHLNGLFRMVPKFGQPMQEFRALLAQDKRVPKLTDKRMLAHAIQMKLAGKQLSDSTKDLFQTRVFKSALDEAIREQQRLIRINPKRKEKDSPHHTSSPAYVDAQVNYLHTGSTEKKDVLPWRQGIKPK